MGAVWQIVTAGSESQQRAAIDVLVETRRKLYGILADGDDADRRDDEEGDGVDDATRRSGSATPSGKRRRPTWASTSPRVG